jgi:hypothetical protein
MKETNLNIFYQFGASFTQLYERLQPKVPLAEIFPYVMLSRESLIAFLRETDEVKDSLEKSRSSAAMLLKSLDEIYNALRLDGTRVITIPEAQAIFTARDEFEKNFEIERQNMKVFTVTPKGIHDIRLLIEKAEYKFESHTRSVFTERVIYDLRQAGRCLAFEVPTAMAFHVMRATETIIKDYYEVLAGNPWPYAQRDWGRYIAELEKLPDFSPVITGRLREIKDLNRNPLIHPEEVVTLGEAPVIFDLCNGVIYYMVEEIRKRRK